jgi:hypothetical protein
MPQKQPPARIAVSVDDVVFLAPLLDYQLALTAGERIVHTSLINIAFLSGLSPRVSGKQIR